MRACVKTKIHFQIYKYRKLPLETKLKVLNHWTIWTFYLHLYMLLLFRVGVNIFFIIQGIVHWVAHWILLYSTVQYFTQFFNSIHCCHQRFYLICYIFFHIIHCHIILSHQALKAPPAVPGRCARRAPSWQGTKPRWWPRSNGCSSGTGQTSLLQNGSVLNE